MTIHIYWNTVYLTLFSDFKYIYWFKVELRWTSHCFPIERAGRQNFMHMLARPRSIETLKIGKQCKTHSIICIKSYLPAFSIGKQCEARRSKYTMLESWPKQGDSLETTFLYVRLRLGIPVLYGILVGYCVLTSSYGDQLQTPLIKNFDKFELLQVER